MFHFLLFLLGKEISIHNNPINLKEDTNTKEERTEKLMYQSFLPLYSLLFLIEINNLTVEQTKYLIKHTIIPAKNYLLKYEGDIQEALREFNTFGPKIVVKDKGLKMPLEFRNSYLEADTSQIAKTLFKQERESLDTQGIDLKKYKSESKNLDKKFIKMVLFCENTL